jgi:glutamine amidotransferase
MAKSVVVFDYGSGNLRSAERALVRVGAEVTVTHDRDTALTADGLVVPGVGAFAACVEGIDAVGGREVVEQRVSAGAPVLGICVGMQVLFELGDEHGVQTKGLALLDGAVRRLDADILPHMGWNTVRADPESVLLDGVAAGDRFYFVHSYAAREPIPDAAVSTAEHGRSVFAAVVERGELRATQFHPEKSGDVGAHLLENWVDSL